MRMTSLTKTLAGAALAAVLAIGASGTAQALPQITGTDDFSKAGVVTSVTTDLAIGDVVSTTLAFIGPGTLNFSGVPGLTFIDSPYALTATVGAASSWTSDVGGFSGNVHSVTLNGNGNGSTLSIVLLGTFTPSGILAASYDASPASEVFAFTESCSQVGSCVGALGISYSFSGTLAAPPNPSLVPEPASMAVLGIGLAGLGLIRRRRQS